MAFNRIMLNILDNDNICPFVKILARMVLSRCNSLQIISRGHVARQLSGKRTGL